MRRIIIILCVAYFLFGCRDDDYFHRPDYLRGNAFEYLDEKGNYTYFIQALEMTGFKDALDGRGLYSVFAPNDEAFKRFLVKKGKTNLKDFHLDTLKMMISYHLIEFSFNREDFNAFTATASAEEPEDGDGSAYKFETLSQRKASVFVDPRTESDKTVYHQRKFLPIISTKLLETQESSDYEGDYKMFFPEINWQGDYKEIYVANAAVVESGIPIDNGYMYIVDEVIELLPTVYEVLGDASGRYTYKIFRSMYDRFSNFQYDEEKSKNFADFGDSLFMFYHYLAPTEGLDLPDLATEWTVSESATSYEDRLTYATNCFAPNDEVLDEYIRGFFRDGNDVSVTSQDLPLLNLFYLLNLHVGSRQEIILPSRIDQGIEGYYGENIKLERSDIDVAELCSNGVFYGINQVFKPTMFTLVMQPLFKYLNYSTTLNIAHKQSALASLVDPEREYTMLVLSDETLKEKYGIYADLDGNPTSMDYINDRVLIKKYTRPVSETEGEQQPDFTLVNMGIEEQQNYIQNHIIDGFIDLEDRGNSRRTYYSTRAPFRFVYTENGELYGEDRKSIGNPIKTYRYDEYENGSGRGIAYEINDKLTYNDESVVWHLFNESSKYKKFYSSLLRHDLIRITPEDAETADDIEALNLNMLGGERLVVFAPTNDVWDESLLPIDSLERDRYLKYYFVPMIANGMADYVLPNYGAPSGEYSTASPITSILMKKVRVDHLDDKRMLLTNEEGLSVPTDGDIPFFATDGLVYGLNELLIPSKDKEEDEDNEEDL